MRIVVAALSVGIAIASGAAVASGCKDEGSDEAPTDVDLGGTFGAEVAVRVVGRGRVTTQPKGIACPGECFTRVVFRPGMADAMIGGISLGAEPGVGASFRGWTFAAVPLGVRTPGPEACSPMMRTSIVPVVDGKALAVTLPLGEANAVPPFGRESECAGFTAAPLAYSVTATFADDVPDGGLGLDGGGDVFVTTPAPGVEARELGIINERVYWRFQTLGDTRSGIATAPINGGAPAVIVEATENISLFDVDAHVMYLRASQPILQVIRADALSPSPLSSAPLCDAVASHASGFWCRFPNGIQSQIYQWPPTGGFPSFVYQVAAGGDLALDDTSLYFSEYNGGGIEAALIRSGPRSGPSAGFFPVHVVDQTTPRDLRVGAKYLFWLDGQVNGVRSARAALKSGMSQQASVTVEGARLIAPDPEGTEGVFWAGVYASGAGFSIVRASASSVNPPRPFRTGLQTLGGLAVDATHVYWTQGDGSIRRASKLFF